MNQKMKKIEYQCCICKGTVKSNKETNNHSLDPCAIIIQSNIDLDYENRKEQIFYVHFECIRKMINDDGVLYIMDKDFPTLGETEEDI